MTRQTAWKAALRLAKKTGKTYFVIHDWTPYGDQDWGDRKTYMAVSEEALKFDFPHATVTDSTDD